MSSGSRQGRSASLVGILSGVVFAVGLALSGMTNPSKVLDFLDVTGDWDPSLAFVMGGAVGAHFVWLRWLSRRVTDNAGAVHVSQPAAAVDARLLLGAGIFGLGWGLAGYCPGPALVAAAYGRREALIFTVAMLGGIALFSAYKRQADGAAHRAGVTTD